MSLTDYTLNKLADHLYNNVPFTSPQVWVGLINGTTELASPAAGGYARVQLDNKLADAVGGVCITNDDLTFPVSSTAWGEVNRVGLYDNSSGDNLLQVIDLPSALNVGINTIVRFPAGQISLGFE